MAQLTVGQRIWRLVLRTLDLAPISENETRLKGVAWQPSARSARSLADFDARNTQDTAPTLRPHGSQTVPMAGRITQPLANPLARHWRAHGTYETHPSVELRSGLSDANHGRAGVLYNPTTGVIFLSQGDREAAILRIPPTDDYKRVNEAIYARLGKSLDQLNTFDDVARAVDFPVAAYFDVASSRVAPGANGLPQEKPSAQLTTLRSPNTDLRVGLTDGKIYAFDGSTHPRTGEERITVFGKVPVTAPDGRNYSAAEIVSAAKDLTGTTNVPNHTASYDSVMATVHATYPTVYNTASTRAATQAAIPVSPEARAAVQSL